MSKAIVLDQPGPANVLQTKDVIDAQPGPKEVQVRHKAISVNFYDIYQRAGTMAIAGDPKIPGISAAGVVEAVGADVKNVNVGDRVAYATAPSGAYSQVRNIHQDLLVNIPAEIDDKMAAAALLKGLTAHFLATRVYIARPGTAVLIHAAAGGVGQLLAQWCNNNGAYVIGTVGSEEKKAVAKASGCHEVFNYASEDWVAGIKKVTKNIGVNAVYDSVGKDTFEKSLDCLMKMGIMILYGQSSGPVTSIPMSALSKKSLYITRPSLFHYKENRMELVLSANEVFQAIIQKQIKVKIFAEYPLDKVSEAHIAMESRKATGPIILIP